MKINNNNPVTPVYSVTPSTRSAEPSGSVGGERADQVHLSDDAKWIAELRAQAKKQPGVREDLVASVKAQLADGTLESGVDMEKVLDGLLADL